MGTDIAGLVIRETAVGESDKALTLLTGELGRITAWARGSRRINSGLRAASQLFTYATFSLSPALSGYRIDNAQVIESFFEIRQDVVRLALASYLAELSGAVTGEKLEEPQLLRLTLNTLYLLSRAEKPVRLLKSAYELRLMTLIGFMPDLSGCQCGQAGALYFNPSSGTLLCEDCRKNEKGMSFAVPAGVLDAMRFVVRSPLQKVFSFELDDGGLKLLADISECFVLTQLERGFKTLEFYKSLI